MLNFQYLPHTRLSGMDSTNRLELILGLIKNNNILIIDGRLKSEEEAILIQRTMELAGTDEKFKGIELGVLHDTAENKSLFKRFKISLAKLLIGETRGLTIIGPANIIRELKYNADSVALHFQKSIVNK